MLTCAFLCARWPRTVSCQGCNWRLRTKILGLQSQPEAFPYPTTLSSIILEEMVAVSQTLTSFSNFREVLAATSMTVRCPLQGKGIRLTGKKKRFFY